MENLFKVFKNMNITLNSYTLVKRHPVNIHIDMENSPKIQSMSNSAGKWNPAMTHQDHHFASLIPHSSHKQDFCHWEPENGLLQILFLNLNKVSFHKFPGILKKPPRTFLREEAANH